MQIYEITSKKAVFEAAAPGSTAAKAGVVGKGFVGALTQKLLPGANTATPGQATTPAGQRGNKAFDVNSPQVALLANKAEAAWTTTLKTMIANSKNPALNTTSLDPAEVERALDDNVSNLLGFNIKTLNTWKHPEGMNVTELMSLAKEAVIKASTDPAQTPEAMKQAWLKMAQAIMEAQIQEEFATSSAAAGTPGAGTQEPISLGPRGEVMIGRNPAKASNPAQLQQMKALKAALEKAGV